jgi:hypothetical protein
MCLTCGTQHHISENHLKQLTNAPRGVLNVRFEQFKGSEYMVLWMEVKTHIAPIHEGYGIDFFQSTSGGTRREVYTRNKAFLFARP